MDFRSRGEPTCPDQYTPNKTSRHSTTTAGVLSFLNRERGFADAAIVNRGRSLKPFLEWLLAQNVSLVTVSPVVITKYFTSSVAGRWKRTTISFHVQSLRSFFRYASSRGWFAAGIAEPIDTPRVYTFENLPQGPTWEEVKKRGTRVNGTSPVQIRSRCAIRLCSVYGLRVGQFCFKWRRARFHSGSSQSQLQLGPEWYDLELPLQENRSACAG